MHPPTSPSSDLSIKRSSTPPGRSLAPDLARGLMLVFIALANVSWFLWGQPAAGMSAHPPPDGALDATLQFVMLIAMDGRSYPLFAFLFGYGMVQFYRSRADRGLEPRTIRRMLRRRHWALLLIGALHAALLFMGDVLGAYAIAGLLLVWIFFGRRDRTLVIWVSIVAGLVAIWSLFSVASGLLLTGAPPEVLAEMNQGYDTFSAGMMRDLAHGQADYLASMVGRLASWAVVSVAQIFTLIIPLAIILGWLAARHRLLDEPWNHLRLLRRVAICGIGIGWLGALPNALAHIGVIDLPDALFWTFMGLTSITGLAGGLGYAAMFGLVAAGIERRPSGSQAVPSPPPVVRGIAAVGQRSLTFYLFQSVVFAPLLSAWGLGLGQHIGTAGALLIALAVWLISIPLAMALASRGMRGPAEVLLRRLTYGKLDPDPRGKVTASGDRPLKRTTSTSP